MFKIDLEICPVPLLLVATSGEIVRTNVRFETLFGYAPGVLPGQNVEVLVPSFVRDRHPSMREAYAKAPKSRRMGTGRDLSGVRQDGVMLPIEVGLEPVAFDGQDMIMVSVIDISERKNREAMFRRALDAAASAMIQIDQQGRIELTNKHAVELFGYSAEQMHLQPIERLIPERYRGAHPKFRADYQVNGEARSMGSGRELFGLRCDGTEFPVEIGLTPVETIDGYSTMATIIDVTELKRNEQFIRQKNEQLRRLNTELLEFSYSASHDLKAPLASITGLLSMCDEDLKCGDTAEVSANIGKAQMLSGRLKDRVERMLTMAKSDSQSSDWEAVDVVQHIDAAWDAIAGQGVTIATCFEHTGVVRSVGARFDAIVENLLSNAVKYQRTEETDKNVQVKTWSSGGNFCLSVSDNGIGIPLEQQQKVFRLFYRSTDSDAAGAGLGLPLVKKNIAHLGGHIGLESGQGKTTFTVTLPQGVTQPMFGEMV